MTWISVAGRRVGWVSIGGITVTRIPVTRKISIGWVAVIGARWRRRCARDTSKNSGCPSDRRSQGGSWPATRRRSNRSTGSRSPKPTGKTALDGIIGVCAGREAQRQSGDYAGRNSSHTAFPQVVDRVQPTSARQIFVPFLATNPGMRLENPGQAATGKRPPAASLVRVDATTRRMRLRQNANNRARHKRSENQIHRTRVLEVRIQPKRCHVSSSSRSRRVAERGRDQIKEIYCRAAKHCRENGREDLKMAVSLGFWHFHQTVSK